MKKEGKLHYKPADKNLRLGKIKNTDPNLKYFDFPGTLNNRSE